MVGSVLTGSIGAVGPLDARISSAGTKIAYWLGITGGWYAKDAQSGRAT